jgi:hypothetical protein
VLRDAGGVDECASVSRDSSESKAGRGGDSQFGDLNGCQCQRGNAKSDGRRLSLLDIIFFDSVTEKNKLPSNAIDPGLNRRWRTVHEALAVAAARRLCIRLFLGLAAMPPALAGTAPFSARSHSGNPERHGASPSI